MSDTHDGGRDTTSGQEGKQESDLPAEIGAPARRALNVAGYRRFQQLTAVTEGEVLRLHGMGPKAMGLLREALSARGLAFAAERHA